MDYIPNKETAALMYIRWLRLNQPQLYQAAMQKTFATNAANNPGETSDSLAGLGTLGDWTDTVSSFFNNVTQLATTYIQDTSQLKTVDANSQRVGQGLPPINANGTIMTPEQMQAAGYSSATITQIEANMAKGAGNIGGALSSMPWYFWAGLAGLGIYLLARRK